MTRHWSERLTCQCGASFRSYGEEAVHRHNFPALCRAPLRAYKFSSGEPRRRVTVRTRDGESRAHQTATLVLDARERQAGREPPRDWDLALVKIIYEI